MILTSKISVNYVHIFLKLNNYYNNPILLFTAKVPVKVLTFTGRMSTAVPITLAEQSDETGMEQQSEGIPGTHLNDTVKK